LENRKQLQNSYRGDFEIIFFTSDPSYLVRDRFWVSQLRGHIGAGDVKDSGGEKLFTKHDTQKLPLQPLDRMEVCLD